MRWGKPLNATLTLSAAREQPLLVTLEENTIHGGAGPGVSNLLAFNNVDTPVLNLGIPDMFVEHGTYGNQKKWIGFDLMESAILNSIQQKLRALESIMLEPEQLQENSIEVIRTR